MSSLRQGLLIGLLLFPLWACSTSPRSTSGLSRSELAAERQRTSPICLRIDSVGQTPGFWSGPVAAVQWVEGTLIADTHSTAGRNKAVRFGIYLVRNGWASHPNTPQLDPAKVSKGRVVGLRTDAECKFPYDDAFAYDQTCVTPTCEQSP